MTTALSYRPHSKCSLFCEEFPDPPAFKLPQWVVHPFSQVTVHYYNEFPAGRDMSSPAEHFEDVLLNGYMNSMEALVPEALAKWLPAHPWPGSAIQCHPNLDQLRPPWPQALIFLHYLAFPRPNTVSCSEDAPKQIKTTATTTKRTLNQMRSWLKGLMCEKITSLSWLSLNYFF